MESQMGEIVDLDAKRPHWSGIASCLRCKHEWVAVAPVGTDDLQCPSCGSGSGVKYSAREVRLIQALEQVATGHALHEGPQTNLVIVRSVAVDALKAEGWWPHAVTQ